MKSRGVHMTFEVYEQQVILHFLRKMNMEKSELDRSMYDEKRRKRMEQELIDELVAARRRMLEAYNKERGNGLVILKAFKQHDSTYAIACRIPVISRLTNEPNKVDYDNPILLFLRDTFSKNKRYYNYPTPLVLRIALEQYKQALMDFKYEVIIENPFEEDEE